MATEYFGNVVCSIRHGKKISTFPKISTLWLKEAPRHSYRFLKNLAHIFFGNLFESSLFFVIAAQIFNVWCLSKLLNWNSVVWYKFETILGAAKTRFKIPWRCPLIYIHYNETSGNNEPRGGPSKFFVTGSKLKLKVQRLKCYIDTLTTNDYTNDKIDRNVKTYDLRDWPILQIALALSITLYLLQQFHTGRLDLPIAPSHTTSRRFDSPVFTRGVRYGD